MISESITAAYEKLCVRCGSPAKRKYCSLKCWSDTENEKRRKAATTPIERLWAKVGIKGTGECWLWTGGVSDSGYGLIVTGSRTDKTRKWVYVHRLAYESKHGPIPPGMEVCHSCDTPRCCNDAHHFLGTRQDNVDDAMVKGRIPHGEASHNSILTEDQVRHLRTHAYAKRGNLTKLAAEFGVDIATAQNAAKGTTWKHLS